MLPTKSLAFNDVTFVADFQANHQTDRVISDTTDISGAI